MIRVLHPIPRGIRTLDRNYSPLWTLYTYESNSSDYRSDLFWGMFQLSRRDQIRTAIFQPFYSFLKDEKGEEHSFLFNLFKMRTENGKTKCSLFYLIRW